MATFGNEPAVEALLRRAAARYRDADRFGRSYVATKLRRDPVHADILGLARRERFGHVLDVGCGRGQLAVALLEAGLATRVTGLDRNERHLAQAAEAAGGLAFEGRVLDVATAPELPDADTVVLVDILYQLPTNAQHALLWEAARVGRVRVIVRTPDPDRGLRSAITRVAERFGRRFWPHSGDAINPRPIAELTAILQRGGFYVTVAPCWRGTPFANVLIAARRRPTAASASASLAADQAASPPMGSAGRGDPDP